MRNTLFILFIISALFLTGCGANSETNSEVIVERELLEVVLKQFEFDEETLELTVKFSSNLPNGTKLEGLYILDAAAEPLFELEDYTIEADLSQVVFTVNEQLREEINDDEEYHLLLKLFISESSNSELLHNKTIAGSFTDMQEVYSDSSFVSLSASNDPNSYSIELTSANKLTMPDKVFKVEEIEEEPIEEVEEVEETTENEEPLEETHVEESFEQVTATDLKQNFDKLLGKQIEVSGEVTQVIEYDEFALSDTSKSFLVNISDPNNYSSNNAVWVEILESPPTLLEGSIISVKGTLLDTYTYDSVAAGRVTVPFILASSITPR
ncbi:hypothetical protein [Alkalihalobacterium elongatum]|uniref:hypothetical protein n=1 Tax=Alkalihalobacterium elongatum TaxID=2675466 RepID=UPI001C1F7D2B|nr:hypothetical protein [Alkalihalobacterium elongatum]